MGSLGSAVEHGLAVASLILYTLLYIILCILYNYIIKYIGKL